MREEHETHLITFSELVYDESTEGAVRIILSLHHLLFCAEVRLQVISTIYL